MEQKTKLDTPQFNLLCHCSIIKLQLRGDEWDHSSQLLHPIHIVNNRVCHQSKEFLRIHHPGHAGHCLPQILYLATWFALEFSWNLTSFWERPHPSDWPILVPEQKVTV